MPVSSTYFWWRACAVHAGYHPRHGRDHPHHGRDHPYHARDQPRVSVCGRCLFGRLVSGRSARFGRWLLGVVLHLFPVGCLAACARRRRVWFQSGTLLSRPVQGVVCAGLCPCASHVRCPEWVPVLGGGAFGRTHRLSVYFRRASRSDRAFIRCGALVRAAWAAGGAGVAHRRLIQPQGSHPESLLGTAGRAGYPTGAVGYWTGRYHASYLGATPAGLGIG